ncbi:MAG: hypothetical protein FWE21_08410 [Defluviitaleaceae bacterium]|nr:hypothetical protein [Defluviitaleaceae bacterium]
MDLLNDYKHLNDTYLILHDMDGDGIPELFILERATYLWGVAAYTFRDDVSVSLDLGHNRGGLSGNFFTIMGEGCIIAFHAMGSGGGYGRVTIDGDKLVAVNGFMMLSEAGWQRSDSGYQVSGLEWYYLTIEGESATIEEFQQMFGYEQNRVYLEEHAINEDNIQKLIFGWAKSD